MSTSILIIGIVVVAAFIIPMALISNHGKVVKEKKKKELDELALSNELSLSDTEFFKEMTLSVDRTAQKLVYITAADKKIIDLNTISGIKLDKTYENEEKKIIGTIDIILTSKEGWITIPFYHYSQKNKLDLYERNESAKLWQRTLELCKAGKA